MAPATCGYEWCCQYGNIWQKLEIFVFWTTSGSHFLPEDWDRFFLQSVGKPPYHSMVLSLKNEKQQLWKPSLFLGKTKDKLTFSAIIN
jgi:hypothetical protein